MLQEQVHNVTKGDNPLAHKAVRQVRFNAWQYAETDLWASLVAELFAQLAAQPGSGRGAEQCGRSRLTAELVAKRGLRERLTAARARRDDLDQALRRARRDDTHAWQELTTTQRERLRTLVGADSERYFRDAMRTAAVLQETGRTWWTLLRGGRLALIAVPLVAAGVITTRRPAATDSTGEPHGNVTTRRLGHSLSGCPSRYRSRGSVESMAPRAAAWSTRQLASAGVVGRRARFTARVAELMHTDRGRFGAICGRLDVSTGPRLCV